MDAVITIPGLDEKAGGTGIEHPDAVALLEALFLQITSNDVQRPIHVVLRGYTEFVIYVVDALLKSQTPIRNFTNLFRMSDDPIIARQHAAPKAPAAIQALNDFFATLFDPISNAVFVPKPPPPPPNRSRK